MDGIKNFFSTVGSFIKENLSSLILILLAIFALIVAIGLPGATYSFAESEEVDANGEINLISLMFGSGEIINRVEQTVTRQAYSGGLSFVALFSFVLLVASVVLIVLDFIFKGKNLKFYGSICMVVSGIAIFFSLTLGTPFVVGNVELSFKDFWVTTNAPSDWHIGLACFLYAVPTIIGGGMVFFKELGKILKAKGFGQKNY